MFFLFRLYVDIKKQKLHSYCTQGESIFIFRKSVRCYFDFKIRAIARGVLLNTRLPSQLIAKIKLGEHSSGSQRLVPYYIYKLNLFVFYN